MRGRSQPGALRRPGLDRSGAVAVCWRRDRARPWLQCGLLESGAAPCDGERGWLDGQRPAADVLSLQRAGDRRYRANFQASESLHAGATARATPVDPALLQPDGGAWARDRPALAVWLS